MTDGPGTLTLVVGPSGAGKDTVLDGARRFLDGDDRFSFPRRAITRPADAGGEDHIPITEREFRDTLDRDGFALDWQAHGLRYGIPRDIERDLAMGRTVVVNASRMVIETARRRYPGTQAIFVSASPEVLARRLAARNRESVDQIRDRLSRTVPPPPAGDGVWQVDNDGSVGEAVVAFVSVLHTINGTAALATTPF
jgi:phosphonate metabolism protein PhnN/1,5-bisphosphokinase (PRPP-forming)